MHWSRAGGAVMLLVGLALLFLLRDALYKFIITVLEVFGIFVGIVLVLGGIALLVGGGWIKRGPFSRTEIGT